MSKKMAVLVDGGFFIKRFSKIYGLDKARDPSFVAEALREVANKHAKYDGRPASEIYRIFFYDCPPLTKRAHYPISKKACNFSSSDISIFRTNLHKELVKNRKLALRLGFLSEGHADWQIRPNTLKQLLNKAKRYEDLTDDDFMYDVRQKQIDMKIGLDIASLSYKNQVEQIVLISGDSDFVPAAKTARREGIDFILNPMWAYIQEDLFEHVDGVHNAFPRPSGIPDNIVHMKVG